MGGGSRISDSKRQQAGFGSSDDAVRLSQPVPRRVLPPTSGPACLPSSPPSRQWHPSMRVCVRGWGRSGRGRRLCADSPSVWTRYVPTVPPAAAAAATGMPLAPHILVPARGYSPSPAPPMCVGVASSVIVVSRRAGGWRLRSSVSRQRLRRCAKCKPCCAAPLAGAAQSEPPQHVPTTHEAAGLTKHPADGHQAQIISHSLRCPRCARQDRPSGGRRAAAALPFIF